MSIFEDALESFIYMNHKRILLSNQIDWDAVKSDFAFSQTGNRISSLTNTGTSGSGVTYTSYTWMADGAKYASARADGPGYVYKGALVFERNAAGKLSLDAANRWRHSGKEEQ